MNGIHHAADSAHDGDSDHDFAFSDTEADDAPNARLGDYSARLEELISDSEDKEKDDEDEEEDEEGFIYNGVDSDPTGGYREQLRQVLGPDHEEDELDEQEVEHSLVHEVAENERFAATIEDEAGVSGAAYTLLHVCLTTPCLVYSSVSRFCPRARPRLHLPECPIPPPRRLRRSASLAMVLRLAHPQRVRTCIHPFRDCGRSLLSRLARPLRRAVPRYTLTFMILFPLRHLTSLPSPDRPPSPISPPSSHNKKVPHRGLSPCARSCVGHSYASSENISMSDKHRKRLRFWGPSLPDRRLSSPQMGLYALGRTLDACWSLTSSRHCDACAVASLQVSTPFVLRSSRILTATMVEKNVGAVTSLALSFDHTYVAAGHATGHIQLFDLRSPKVPARVVPPTNLASVASGRQEGHLAGSRIVNVGFLAGRHTALVSADDSGLAFYHSLGKVFFVDATDILRILGKYPDEDAPDVPAGLGHRFRRRKPRKPTTILAMAPLPFGTAAHPTDEYNLVALLTPIKLVIVGLKPSPKTWYRRHRATDDEVSLKSKFKGTLAWFPSVSVGADPTSSPERDTKKTQINGVHPASIPMLVYSWGESMHLIRVSESKITQTVKDAKTGKTNKVEVGRIVFEEVGSWNASDDIVALQWLNVNVGSFTPTSFSSGDLLTFI